MTSRIRAMFVATIVSLGFTVGAQAANVVGSSGLLSASDASQIETWLGQGSVQFDNVFTKVSGSTSVDFHAAADGKGATISIFSVTYGNGAQALIGGYNPSSWNAGLSNYNYTNAGGAFLFNLTSGLVQQQRAEMSYQTYNAANYGPTFGGGHDLVANSTYSNSNFGYALSHTYGLGTSYGGVNILGSSGYQQFTWVGLEVFTISPYQAVSAVPEPETYAMMLAGLCLVGTIVRRRKVRQA